MKLRILALLLALLSVFSVIAMTGCSESGEKDTGKIANFYYLRSR